MAKLRQISIYPVKALDPVDREQTRIATHGVLDGDREYAIVDNPVTESHDPNEASVSGDGDYMNGKRTVAVHRLRSSVDFEERTLTLRVNGDSNVHRFDFDNRSIVWLEIEVG